MSLIASERRWMTRGPVVAALDTKTVNNERGGLNQCVEWVRSGFPCWVRFSL